MYPFSDCGTVVTLVPLQTRGQLLNNRIEDIERRISDIEHRTRYRAQHFLVSHDGIFVEENANSTRSVSRWSCSSFFRLFQARSSSSSTGRRSCPRWRENQSPTFARRLRRYAGIFCGYCTSVREPFSMFFFTVPGV